MIVGFIKSVVLENGFEASFWAIEMQSGKLNNAGEPLSLNSPRTIPFEITLFKDFDTWVSGGRKIESPTFNRLMLPRDEIGNEITPVMIGGVYMTLPEIDGEGTLSIFATRIKESIKFFNDAINIDI